MLRKNGDTILHVCAGYGQAALLAKFKEHFNDELDIKNTLHETPFITAAREGRLNVLKLFYERWKGQFFADSRTKDDWTAFNYACLNGFLATIQFLANQQYVDIHSKDRVLRNSLHWAARFNNVKVVELLLKLNLRIDAVDRENMTAIDLCRVHNSNDAEAAIQDKIKQAKEAKR